MFFRSPRNTEENRSSGIKEKRIKQGAMQAGASATCSVVFAAAVLLGAAVCSMGMAGALMSVPLFAAGVITGALLLCWGAGILRAVPGVVAFAALMVAGLPGALYALAALAAAFILYLCSMSRRNKFETVAWMMAGVCAVLFCAFLYVVYLERGSVGADAVGRYLSAVTDALKQNYLTVMGEIASVPLGNPVMEEYIAQLNNETVAAQLARNFVCVVPAYAAAACSVLCFVTVTLFVWAAGKIGHNPFFLTLYVAPVSSAYIYLTATLLEVFVSVNTVFGLALQYVTVLLLPCFLYFGFRGVIAILKARAGWFVKLAVIGVGVFLFFTMGQYVFSLIAFFGAFIVSRIRVYDLRDVK